MEKNRQRREPASKRRVTRLSAAGSKDTIREAERKAYFSRIPRDRKMERNAAKAANGGRKSMKGGVRKVSAVLILLCLLCLSLAMGAAGETAAGQIPAQAIHPEVFLKADLAEVRQGLFTLRIPADFTRQDSGREENDDARTDWATFGDGSGNNFVYVDIRSMKENYSEDPEVARSIYQSAAASVPGEVLWQREITLDGGYPAYVTATSRVIVRDENYLSSNDLTVWLWYLRGSSYLRMYYEMTSEPSLTIHLGNVPTADQFLPLLSAVSYGVPESRKGLPSWLLTTESFDAEVSAPEGQTAISAGQRLQLTHAFRDQEIISQKPEALRQVTWSLVETAPFRAGGTRTEVDAGVARINQEGQIRVGSIQEPTAVTAVADSPASGRSASLDLTLLPVPTDCFIEATEGELIWGTDSTLSLRFRTEPEDAIEYNGVFDPVAWRIEPAEGAEVLQSQGGTLTLRAIRNNDIQVHATDRISGKRANITLKVTVPVTGLTIDGPDELKPGETGRFSVGFKPKKATKKEAVWSVDADPAVAVINGDGVLQVEKTAPVGTVILITCQAEGYQETVTATHRVVIQ